MSRDRLWLTVVKIRSLREPLLRTFRLLLVYTNCQKCGKAFMLRDAPPKPSPLFSELVGIQNRRQAALFDGETDVEERDGTRLRTQREAVLAIMQDCSWHTLRELADSVGGSEASVSARFRDLRKDRFGGHLMGRKYLTNGLFTYRLANPA